MKVEGLIAKKDYVEAAKCLVNTINISEKMVKEKFYNLYKIYLLFLSKQYQEVINLHEKVIDSIKKSKVDNKDTNDYYLLFVFTMVFISSTLTDNEKLKTISIENIIVLKLDYKNIDQFELRRFPMFDADKLLEYFREEGEPEELNKEKLIYLLDSLNSDPNG